jgi:oxygen-independent coproporphyrinogen-3 oxidase
VRLPPLRARRAHYRAITRWCAAHGYARVSVWGFRRGGAPRYSSVTRDGYIGVGPGAGSHLPDSFALNTFDLESWCGAALAGRSPIALRLPFGPALAGWWWLYWRLYEGRVPLRALDDALGPEAPKARRVLAALALAGLAARRDGWLELTEPGAFWVHLAQNYFALDYVNTLWTRARGEAWPPSIAV